MVLCLAVGRCMIFLSRKTGGCASRTCRPPRSSKSCFYEHRFLNPKRQQAPSKLKSTLHTFPSVPHHSHLARAHPSKVSNPYSSISSAAPKPRVSDEVIYPLGEVTLTLQKQARCDMPGGEASIQASWLRVFRVVLKGCRSFGIWGSMLEESASWGP